MSVRVRVLITPVQVLGNRTYTVPVAEPVPLGDLLRGLPLPQNEEREIWEEQHGEPKLRTGLAVLVNGMNVMHSAGLDTEVHDGDRVSLIHGISGG